MSGAGGGGAKIAEAFSMSPVPVCAMPRQLRRRRSQFPSLVKNGSRFLASSLMQLYLTRRREHYRQAWNTVVKL